MYPLVEYRPTKQGPSDQTLEEILVDLAKMQSAGYMRIIKHGGERGYHVKLVLDDKKLISLFVWNEKLFKGQRTLVRSYGIWPIDVMEVDPEEGDVLVAEGRYELKNGTLTLCIEKTYAPEIAPQGCRTFRLKLARVKEYTSPKHGWSARPEYYAIPASA